MAVTACGLGARRWLCDCRTSLAQRAADRGSQVAPLCINRLPEELQVKLVGVAVRLPGYGPLKTHQPRENLPPFTLYRLVCLDWRCCRFFAYGNGGVTYCINHTDVDPETRPE